MAQLIKNQPAMRETWVQSLDLEDPLEKEKENSFPGEFHRLYSPWGCKESEMTELLVAQCKVSACQHRRHGFDP